MSNLSWNLNKGSRINLTTNLTLDYLIRARKALGIQKAQPNPSTELVKYCKERVKELQALLLNNMRK